MRRLGFACILVSMLVSQPAWAVGDAFKITASEKAACTADAMRFCAYTYPNENQLLSCMKSNRTSLSATCLVAFDAGLKRRHLN